MKFNKNKAAMFGLDARIALAIFGALSVISGAALYSAIQGAKVTAIITELNEIGKGFEAYLLDTGNSLSITTNTYNIQNLIENLDSAPNWQGPYLSYEVAAVNRFNHNTYENVHIFNRPSSGWAGSTGLTPSTACTSNCRVFTTIVGLPSNIVKAIDLQVDGSENLSSGKVLGLDRGNGTHNIYYVYMIDPYNNP